MNLSEDLVIILVRILIRRRSDIQIYIYGAGSDIGDDDLLRADIKKRGQIGRQLPRTIALYIISIVRI